MGQFEDKVAHEKAFYFPQDPEISEITRKILTEYSGIPEDNIIKHIREIRDAAWSANPYPCLGNYAFLNFSITSSPHYNFIVENLKSDPRVSLIDIGCCFGQDIRKLIVDGVPSSQLHGSEYESTFIGLGYDLFRDRMTLGDTFVAEDFFAPATGLKKSKLTPGEYDYVHAAAFFHIFSWDEQVEAISRAINLLKPVEGTMVFGRQIGVSKPRAVQYYLTKSGEMYRHDAGSLRKCIEEAVGKLEVEVKIDVIEGVILKESEEDGEVRYLTFCISRV